MQRYQVRIAPIIIDGKSPEDAACNALAYLVAAAPRLPGPRANPVGLLSLSVRALSGSRETEFRVAELARTPEVR